METSRREFASQADPLLIDAVRDIAAEEGRQFQVVLEEAVHEVLSDEFGGSDEVRDLGALESALFRPRTGHCRDVIAEAAALFEGLVQDHPFVDGYERVAFAVMDAFLRLDGHELVVEDVAAHAHLVGLMARG